MKRLLALLSQPVTEGFLWHQSVKEMGAIRHRSESGLCQSRPVFHQKQRRALGRPERRPRFIHRARRPATIRQ